MRDGVTSSVTSSVVGAASRLPALSTAKARMRFSPAVNTTLWAVKIPRPSVVMTVLGLMRSSGSNKPSLFRSLNNHTVLLGAIRPAMLTGLVWVMRSSGHWVSWLVVLIHSVFSKARTARSALASMLSTSGAAKVLSLPAASTALAVKVCRPSAKAAPL